MDVPDPVSQLLPRNQPGMGVHVAWLARRFGRRELAPFSPADVEALSQTLRRVEVPAGQRLASAGQTAGTAYVVERGAIELFLSRRGRRHLVAIHRSGGVVGDIPLLCAMPFPYTAVARSHATVLAVEHDALLGLLTAHPAIALRWLTSTVRRLEHANRRIAALTQGNLRDRLLALLADELASGDHTRVDLTQSEMAALLGATRQSVNRVLGDLADEAVVRTDYGGVEIRDAGRLLELAGQGALSSGPC